MGEKKRYILVTGASSGIGACLAINLSRDHHIILHGRDEERLNRTKALCNQANDHLVYVFDLARSAELEKSFTAFIAENEAEVSHFVHSAGHMKMLPLKMVSLEAINTTFAVNVISAVLLIKLLVQRKINADALSGVVLISSNISNFGAKALSVYGASKGAMDSMMKCLAVELAPKVRLNSVLPGALDTGMTRNIFGDKELLDRMMKEYPLGAGEPNDIFEMVNFLLSERSKWITGQQFAVDGGRTINISG